MKRVGEWVGRMPKARSPPRGETDPPMTLISAETDFSAS
jgi:hypothetical protein